MGICASCNSAALEGTTKVVLPEGGLREYARPVTVANVLGKDAECFFVCDADEMEFEGFVSAVGADEELRLGQLYFVLPRTILSYPLHAEDLATLAVRASSALVGAARRCGRGAVAPLGFPVDREAYVAGKKGLEEKGRRRSRKGGVGGRKFAPELVAIPE